MAIQPVFLPNDNTLNPSFASPPGPQYVWLFPTACTLTRVALHGNANTLGSLNNRENPPGTPVATDFVVIVNGVQAPVLFTLPLNTQDIDLSVNPQLPIPAGAEVQFAFIADPAVDSGGLFNFLLSFLISP